MAASNTAAPAPIAIFFQVFIDQVFTNQVFPRQLLNGRLGTSAVLHNRRLNRLRYTQPSGWGTSSDTARPKQKFPITQTAFGDEKRRRCRRSTGHYSLPGQVGECIPFVGDSALALANAR